LPVENYFKIKSVDTVLTPANRFFNLVEVNVDVDEIIEISSDVCFELQDSFTGMDPLLYIETKDTATSTKLLVSATKFVDSAAASGAIRCGTVSWKGAIVEDGTISVWVRGNSVEDGNITVLANVSNVSYKIWEDGYTSPDDDSA